MIEQKDLDRIANLWNKTKELKYKNLWYKRVKEFANGPHNIKRWTVSIDTSDKENARRNRTFRRD